MQLLKQKFWHIFNILTRKHVVIIYKKNKDELKIKARHTFEDRGIKSESLFLQAFEKAKPKVEKSFRTYIFCGDKMDMDWSMFSYSKRKNQTKINVIPDFLFINWKECGIEDYESCWKKMVEMSKIPPENNTLFWIGNVKTHPSREILCELSQQDLRIEAYGMNWKSNRDFHTGEVATKYVSLIDHTKYKYLIDIQGAGWSARTKLLFFTGRPLFLVEREWKEYWYDMIEPYKHYIPVKEDLSDLIEQLDWAEAHPKETEIIANNAQKFAIENLKRDDAIDYFSKVIVRYANEKR